MAGENGAGTGSGRGKAAKRSLGQMLPALVVIGLIGLLLSFYFFNYVPKRLEYFESLRFRTLATAVGAIKTNIESLENATSLLTTIAPDATDSNRRLSDLRTYTRRVLPSLRLNGSSDDAAVPPNALVISRRPLPLQAAGGDAECRDKAQPGECLIAWTTWANAVRDASAIALSGDSFTDFVVAESNGRVVYQHRTMAAHIVSVANLQPTAGAPAAAISAMLPGFLKSGSDTKAGGDTGVEAVAQGAGFRVSCSLGGKPSLILVQPFSVGAQGRLYYAVGILPESQLQSDAMSIPPARVILFGLPLAILFFALPILKLHTLKPRERYQFRDFLVLVLSTVLLAAIPAAWALSPATSTGETDASLTALAASIDKRTGAEIQRLLDLIDYLRGLKGPDGTPFTDSRTPEDRVADIIAQLHDCEVKLKGLDKRSCELSRVLAGIPKFSSIELDVAFWIHRSGRQIRKWSTRTQSTAVISVREHAYFGRATTGDLCVLRSEGKGRKEPFTPHRFAVEALIAPTTSEPAFTITVPDDRTLEHSFDAGGRPAAPGDRQSVLFTINVRPTVLADAVAPPEYGFAVLGREGQVLFHSQRERNQRENFLQELTEQDDLRQTMNTGEPSVWNSDYRGRPHRLLAIPFSEIDGSGWTIVAFRDLEPPLGFAATIARTVAVLFGLQMLFLLIVLLALPAIPGVPRDERATDYLIRLFWPNPAFLPQYRFSVRCMAGLVVLSTIVAVSVVRTDTPYLSFAFFYFLALPFIAVAVARVPILLRGAAAQEYPLSAPVSSTYYRWHSAKYAFLLALIGMAPPAGLMLTVYRFEDVNRLQHWLDRTRQSELLRDEQVVRRVSGRQYVSSAATPPAQQVAAAQPVRDRRVAAPIVAARTAAAPPPEPDAKPDAKPMDRYAFQRGLTRDLKVAMAPPEPAPPDAAPAAASTEPVPTEGCVDAPERPFSYASAVRSIAGPRDPTRVCADNELARAMPRYQPNAAQRFVTWINRLVLRSESPYLVPPVDVSVTRAVKGTKDLDLAPVGESQYRERRDYEWLGIERAVPYSDQGSSVKSDMKLFFTGALFHRAQYSSGLLLSAAIFLPFLLWVTYHSANKLHQRELCLSIAAEVRDPYIPLTKLFSLIQLPRAHILLVGLPRSGKDQEMRRQVEARIGDTGRSMRIRLLDVDMTPEWVTQKLSEIRAIVREMEEEEPEQTRELWIRVSNLESQLGKQASRRQMLRFVQGLMGMTYGRVHIRMALTSTIDPIMHLGQILDEEHESVYSAQYPEQQIQEWSVCLSNFHKCYDTGDPGDIFAGCDTSGAEPWVVDLMRRECEWHPKLVRLGRELISLGLLKPPASREFLERTLGQRAEAVYHLVWASCTRAEKLLLAQLARTGYANPNASVVLEELHRKGIVGFKPAPTITSRLFARFLRDVESESVLSQWESEFGSGTWAMSTRLVTPVFVAALVFYLVTQGRSIDSIMPILTTTGLLGLPKLGDLIAGLGKSAAGTGNASQSG